MRSFNGERGGGRALLPYARFVCRAVLAGAALAALAGCQQEQASQPAVAVEVPVEVPEASAPAEATVATSGCQLPELRAATQFLVEAWAVPDPQYNVGEPLSLQMRVGAPAYVNVFHVSTSCKVTRLLQNRLIAAAEIIDFPLAGSGIEMIVKPPAGAEAFYFVATREQIDVLAAADMLGSGEIVGLDLSPAEFYTRIDQITGRINPNDLGVTTLRTLVVGN